MIVDFTTEWERLKAAKSGASKIVETIPQIPEKLCNYAVETGNDLLKKVIEHPELSEREQYLLGLVQIGKGEELRTTAQEFESVDLERCPKCHQPLSVQYKNGLIASIQKVLSEEVQEHQRLLGDHKLSLLEMDLLPFQQLAHYQECVAAIECVNQIVQSNNALLETKQVDPYSPVQEELSDMGDALVDLRTTLQQLESDRTAHNKTGRTD